MWSNLRGFAEEVRLTSFPNHWYYDLLHQTTAAEVEEVHDFCSFIKSRVQSHVYPSSSLTVWA